MGKSQEISEQEFIRLILHTQKYLTQNGFSEIIDGPKSIKDSYTELQRDRTYLEQEKLSLSETIQYAKELLNRAEGLYGKNDFRTWTIGAQLAALGRIKTKIPIEDLVYQFYGIDVLKLYEIFQDTVAKEKDAYCRLLGCTEKDLRKELSNENARLQLTPDEARRFLGQAEEIAIGNLREIFSEEEIGETEIKEVNGVELGYNEPIAIGKSRISISFKSRSITPTSLLHIISHESFHTIGYGMQMRSGETVPENKVILLNTVHVPFQEGLANGGAIIFYPDARNLIEKIDPLLPEGKKLDLFNATQYLENVTLYRAYWFTVWFDRVIKNVPENKLAKEVSASLGLTPEQIKSSLKFMDKWTSYYPVYAAANAKIIPELKRALDQSPQQLYEKVKEFATQPNPSIFR